MLLSQRLENKPTSVFCFSTAGGNFESLFIYLFFLSNRADAVVSEAKRDIKDTEEIEEGEELEESEEVLIFTIIFYGTFCMVYLHSKKYNNI